MAPPPIVFPPPAWANQNIVVYHGAVDPTLTFGPGFYTTTMKRQAQMWAAQISASRPGTAPAVIEISIPRTSLAKLDTLAFVRGDFDADDYWSLIHHCRKGADADQISFHTTSAEAVLNSSLRRRII
jgi:hypothetical protein